MKLALVLGLLSPLDFQFVRPCATQMYCEITIIIAEVRHVNSINFGIQILAHQHINSYVTSSTESPRENGVATVQIDKGRLFLSHGRGLFCLHVQWFHHIWQCWCCSVWGDLQNGETHYFVKVSTEVGLLGHLRGFSFPSEDHGSRGLGLAAGSQKAQGFKACRVIQL